MGMMETDMATAEKGLSHGLVLLGHRIRWRTVILLLIVAVLLLTRLWDMNNRSYSHDESTHAWESWKLVSGQRYVHDPVYHGPFMYHVTALFYVLFGVSDVTARLGASLFAVALVLLVWPLRRWLGRAGALFAMFLLTISPTMMHRGRFIRHDVFVIVPAMVMMVAFFHYMEDRKERWLYIAAGALSLFLRQGQRIHHGRHLWHLLGSVAACGVGTEPQAAARSGGVRHRFAAGDNGPAMGIGVLCQSGGTGSAGL